VTDRIEAIRSRLRQLDEQVADPQIFRDQAAYRELMRERARLGEIDDVQKRFDELLSQIADARAMLAAESDPEMLALAQDELELLESRREGLESALQELLAPRDPLADKPVIMEIRAGTGGEEAALFAADLFRMYSRYADSMGWRTEVMSENATELGGLKEIVFSVNGEAVYERLRWESGVHRVQRVPSTEGSGRIHTSAVTVAVLPEVEDTEIEIRPEDLRVDVMRSGGPGGQSVNTTDSAVRMTHLPTGTVVSMQNEKSQIQNRAAALRVMQSRLLLLKKAEEAAERKELAGDIKASWGDQMRSYVLNPYQMVKDLRTEHETGNPDKVFDGDIDDFIEAGIRWQIAQRKAEG